MDNKGIPVSVMALLGLFILITGIGAGKKLASQSTRFSPLAVKPNISPTPTPTPKTSNCSQTCNYSVNPQIICQIGLSCYYLGLGTPAPGAPGVCRKPGCQEKSDCICAPTITGINLPDLVVTQMKIELETRSGCYNSPPNLRLSAYIKNIGNTEAGQFVVDVNGDRKTVTGGLPAGQTAFVWGFNLGYGQPATAFADATFLVEESNEDNNELTALVPIPTLPPVTCTPTPSSGAEIPGDANGDNKVDGLDYVIWLNNYNKTVTTGSAAGDFDKNGKVDGIDYVKWLIQYIFMNQISPTPTITPSPSISLQQTACENQGYIWKIFSNGCVDSCDLAANPQLNCTQVLTPGCDCGADSCWNGTSCQNNP